MGKGHAMLIGEGGSGRHSLTKLAASIAKYDTFQISVSKGYRTREFREDIKKISKKWGEKNKSGVFLFADNEIILPSFLEDVNNLLACGEVPNLFDSEAKTIVISSITKKAQKAPPEEGPERVAKSDQKWISKSEVLEGPKPPKVIYVWRLRALCAEAKVSKKQPKKTSKKTLISSFLAT